ncbi:hypothetical protein NFI96_007354, partial [Prochilodus magdalenae]
CTLENRGQLLPITAHTGGSVLLPCSCTDLQTTPEEFTWKKYKGNKWVDSTFNSDQYRNKVQMFHHRSPGNLSLLISHLTEEDGGEHKCAVKGSYMIIRLTLEEGPPGPTPSTAPKPTPSTAPKPAPSTAPKTTPPTAPQPAPSTAPKPAPSTTPKPASSTAVVSVHTSPTTSTTRSTEKADVSPHHLKHKPRCALGRVGGSSPPKLKDVELFDPNHHLQFRHGAYVHHSASSFLTRYFRLTASSSPSLTGYSDPTPGRSTGTTRAA